MDSLAPTLRKLLVQTEAGTRTIQRNCDRVYFFFLIEVSQNEAPAFITFVFTFRKQVYKVSQKKYRRSITKFSEV